MAVHPFHSITERPRLMTALNMLIRGVVLAYFALTLYNVEYERVRQEGFYLSFELRQSTAAANVGFPFYFYRGDENDNPPDLTQRAEWSLRAGDYGIQILAVGTSVIGRVFDADFKIDNRTPYQALYALFIFTAVVFLWPSVPLPIGLAGVLSLALGIFEGPIALVHEARAWGVTYMAVLVGMAIVTSIRPKRGFWAWSHLFLLSFLIGFATLLRQESVGSATITGLALLGLVWLMAAIAYRILPNRVTWQTMMLPLVRRVTITALALIAAVFITPYIMRGVYSVAWDRPYSETHVIRHGAGLPLYLGLGYVSNPYNIAWLDPIGDIHARLYNPNVPRGHNDPEFQRTLQSAWREITLEDPALVLENVRQKVDFMHAFLWNGRTPYETSFLLNSQPRTQVIIYRLALLVLFTSPLLIVYKRSPAALLMTGAVVALILGASAGPLTGFPSYIGGAQGALMVVALILPAAYVELLRQPELDPNLPWSRILWWTVGLIAALGLLGIAFGGAYTWLRENSHQNELESIQNAAPLAELNAREFQYGHLFNDLSIEAQEAIITELQTSGDARVAVPSETDSSTVFRVEAAVLTEKQLHVIVWLGSEYPGPVDFVNQARVYSIIQVCAGCTEVTRSYDYEEDSIVYTYLNDTDWQDSYRLLSFPVDAAAFAGADRLMVVPQRIRFWDGNATEFGYMVDELDVASMLEFRNK